MQIRSILVTIVNFLALILILQSCQCAGSLRPPIMNAHARHKTFEVYVSSEYDISEVGLIEEAIMEWEQSTNHIVTFNLYLNFDMKNYDKLKDPEHNTLVITRMSKNDPLVRELDGDVNAGTTNRLIGYCYYHPEKGYPITTLIIVWDRMVGDDYFRGTVMHEMGHALGLNHIHVEDTLMYPFMNLASRHITETDLASFCEIYHCKVSELK